MNIDLVMNKTKLKELVDKIRNEERDIILDPECWEDNTPAEKKQAEKEFDAKFKKVKTFDQLVEVLEYYGFEYTAALERIIRVLLA
jgi:hypothetical protein